MTFALRNFGPRVFISYSFRDTDLAIKLERILSGKGFQIRREDETSLANQRLTDAIPKRIAAAEVILQLLTSASNASEWVAREFEYATELRDKDHAIVLLPVVFEKASLPEAVKRWWYLDASSEGLTDQVIATIEPLCLRAVHLLPLDEDDPTKFNEAEAGKFLASLLEDPKRDIVDSGGLLRSWAQDNLDFIAKSDSPYRAQALNQEQRRVGRLERRYSVIDEVVKKLGFEFITRTASYSSHEDQVRTALIPLQRYARIVVGDDVLRTADMAPPAPHPLRERYEPLIAAARESNTANHSSGFCNPGFYAWAFEEQTEERDMVVMGLDAHDFRSIPVLLPRSTFGSMAEAYTRR